MRNPTTLEASMAGEKDWICLSKSLNALPDFPRRLAAVPQIIQHDFSCNVPSAAKNPHA